MLLRNIPLFTNLGDSEIAEISAQARTLQLPKNYVIINEGESSDSLYIIAAGKVKVLSGREEGKEVIFSILRPGDFFGEMALFDDQARSATVITMEHCVFNVIAQADFMRCVSGNPHVARHLLQALAQRLRKANRKISNLVLMDIYGRVAQTLMELAQEEEGKLVVRQNLSQQDLANMVGVSRETVNRILSDLASGGYIEVKTKSITINEALPPMH
jgi:CRP/FNR family cyclic AMP-dependent transcriptional regulator